MSVTKLVLDGDDIDDDTDADDNDDDDDDEFDDLHRHRPFLVVARR